MSGNDFVLLFSEVSLDYLAFQSKVFGLYLNCFCFWYSNAAGKPHFVKVSFFLHTRTRCIDLINS